MKPEKSKATITCRMKGQKNINEFKFSINSKPQFNKLSVSSLTQQVA